MVLNATCGVCHAPLPPGARVCPNCGHAVDRGPADPPTVAGGTAARVTPASWSPFARPAAPRTGNGTGSLDPADPDATPGGIPVAPAVSSDSSWLSGRSSAPPPVPAPHSEPIVMPVPGVTAAAAPQAAATTAPPTGALVLLPGEEVLMQLGALYLTNRRAILYAPTILRAAYLRDIDAIGTITERSSGWMLLLGVIGLGLAALSAYIGVSQPGLEFQIGDAYHASPLLMAIPLALIGVLTLASYFFWVKRSLFLSVGGRPLIVVSLSGWSGKKLTAVDSFVNAFTQAKEAEGR